MCYEKYHFRKCVFDTPKGRFCKLARFLSGLLIDFPNKRQDFSIRDKIWGKNFRREVLGNIITKCWLRVIFYECDAIWNVDCDSTSETWENLQIAMLVLWATDEIAIECFKIQNKSGETKAIPVLPFFVIFFDS